MYSITFTKRDKEPKHIYGIETQRQAVEAALRISILCQDDHKIEVRDPQQRVCYRITTIGHDNDQPM